ncbi:MFS transporter [Plantibacter sp. YIM 135347]|uniref:MFS transporter n=1 Tax=Plantibacter sp. YIM 135347 TaxID=3423919 RepID=UPI003D337992
MRSNLSPVLGGAAPRVPGGRKTPRRTLRAGWALAGTALAFASLYLGAGALTPLLVVYRQEWDFPPSMLTLAFAAYALGFLVAALTLGSLSDHIGRRPVLIAALVVQLGSNVVFLVAPDVGWVLVGRIVQGVASGAATAAFTAAMVELAPPDRKRLAAILGSVSLTGGLAIGSLLAGLAIQLTPAASTIVFVTLILLTVVGGLVVFASPETVDRTPGAIRSMIPNVAIPIAAGKEFAAVAPVVAAVWMLAGLSGGIAPSLVHSVFHLDSGLLNGVAGFIAPAVSAAIGLSFARVDSRRAMTIGITAALIGAAGIIAGVLLGSIVVMIVGQAVAGVAFGASFTAALRLLVPLAGPNQRAGVVAAVYVVSYTAFGLPIIIEGQLVGAIGVVPAVVGYTGLTMLLVLVSLIARARLRRSS